jgi:hypothetical protein
MTRPEVRLREHFANTAGALHGISAERAAEMVQLIAQNLLAVLALLRLLAWIGLSSAWRA